MSKTLPILGQDPERGPEESEKAGLPRRDFVLLVIGWVGSLASLGAAAFAGIRGLLPNLLDEPDQRFRVGKPEDFGADAVQFLSEIRTFLIRKDAGFRAMSGVCTHLGCTVNHETPGFRCPCHGSVFDEEGNVLSGPAPRPLESYHLALSRDGRLVVDRSRSVSPGDVLLLENRGPDVTDPDAGERS